LKSFNEKINSENSTPNSFKIKKISKNAQVLRKEFKKILKRFDSQNASNAENKNLLAKVSK